MAGKFTKWLTEWPVYTPSEFKPTYRDLEAEVKVLKAQINELQHRLTRLQIKLVK